jgi:hypothetical protein
MSSMRTLQYSRYELPTSVDACDVSLLQVARGAVQPSREPSIAARARARASARGRPASTYIHTYIHTYIYWLRTKTQFDNRNDHRGVPFTNGYRQR